MICPICGYQNPDGSTNCGNCHNPLPKIPHLSKADIPVELQNYVTEQLKNGFGEDQIRKALLDVGWTEDLVEESFEQSLPEQSKLKLDVSAKESGIQLPPQSLTSMPSYDLASKKIKEAQSASTTPKKYNLNLLIAAFVFLALLILGGYLVSTRLNLKSFLKTPSAPSNQAQSITPSPTLALAPTESGGGYHEDTLSNFSLDQLKSLGVIPLPTGFSVQDEYKGIKLVKSPKQSFSDVQLKLIKMFIDLTPYKLLTPGPSAIVTYGDGEVSARTTSQEVAFASGPYVFFNDKSFNQSEAQFNADGSIDTVYASFEHELTHVAQFNTMIISLDTASLNNQISEGKGWTDLVFEGSFMKSFGQTVGWTVDEKSNPPIYTLKDLKNAKTTDYGKTGVMEDMAETVSGIINTRDYQFSDARVKWTDDFLNETKDILKINKFPFSAKLELVKVTLGNVEYDKTKETDYKSKYPLTDLEYLSDSTLHDIDNIKNYFQTEMTDRGWSGSFTKSTDSHNVIHYKGDFIGAKRDIYLEIISYDDATGYITKPNGTIVVAISGYKF